MRLIGGLALCVVATLVAALAAPGPAGAQDLSAGFTPPLTAEERALLTEIASDPKEIGNFIATRLFMRRLAEYTAPLAKGMKYRPRLHGCPAPPENISFSYMLNDDEASLLFDVKLACSAKKAGFESKCGQMRISIEGAPTGGTAATDADKALAQFSPPASADELRLFETARRYAAEIPKFVATRLYMRQVNALVLNRSGESRFDPSTAPAVPKDVVFDYTLDVEEAGLLFDIRVAMARKALGR